MDQYGYHKIIFVFYIVAFVKSSLRNHAPIIAFVKSSLRNHAPLENGQALLKCSQIQTSQCHKIHSKLFKNKLASSKLRQSETMTDSLTESLTEVKCRATSVAKKQSMLIKTFIITISRLLLVEMVKCFRYQTIPAPLHFLELPKHVLS